MVIDDIKKIASGSKVLTGAMSFKTDAPLDDRFTVKNKAGLICKDVFGVYEENKWKAKKDWIYQGMSTTVLDTGFTYVLSNINSLTLYSIDDINTNIQSSASWLDTEIAKSWTRVATENDITTLSNTINTNMQQLAGVFQFKGVADSVDQDFTIITVVPLSYNGVSDYKCVGFNYDLAHDIYYRWESGANTYYTKAGDATHALYTIGQNEAQVLCVEHNGEIFYSDGTVGTAPNERSKFTSLVGNSIYALSVLNSVDSTAFYFDPAATNEDTPDFTTTPIVYNAYSFTPMLNESTPITAALGTGVEKHADSTNVGHVYQIGEKEYASNGLIWVELGSPKQEINWLVL